MQDNRTQAAIRKAIWVYFWLLIFEGALRKWILPQFSAPLLLVRDPVLLYIYWQAFDKRKLVSPRMFVFLLIACPVVLLACAQVTTGVEQPIIAIYGLRSYLLHVPLIFIIADTFSLQDVEKVGRYLLLLSIPMAILMLAQFRAPADSWLNAGAGEGSSQIAFTGDHARASGTFSFATGSTSFFPFVISFLFYRLFRPRAYPLWLVAGSAVAVLVAIPVAGSRTLLFVTATLVLCVIPAAMTNLKFLERLTGAALVFLLLFAIALRINLLRDAFSAFQERWGQAAEVEGNTQSVLDKRLVNVITESFDTSDNSPLLGKGIGMGSNVAAVITSGSQDFLLAEMEWSRVILEFGPILGFLFMSFRLLLCGDIVLTAVRSLRGGAKLSWLLVPATLPILLINTMEQPTNLGFMVLGAGLCLAAGQKRKSSRPVRLVASQLHRNALA